MSERLTLDQKIEHARVVPDVRGRDSSELVVPRALYQAPQPSVRLFVDAVNTWQKGIYDIDQIQPSLMLSRQGEEVTELREAVGNRGNPEEILEESIDVIIGTLGIALTVAEPKRVAEAMFDKLVLMLRKYDPKQIEALKAEGLPTYKALDTMKTLWRADHPNM